MFDLLGHKENDLTAALGFALARCPQLCAVVAARIAPREGGSIHEPAVALEVRDNDGRTDLELRIGKSLYIFEAKRGWLLPEVDQLARYARRIQGNSGRGGLVTLSQASQALAAHRLPSEVHGVSVMHLSWREVLDDIGKVEPKCRGRERVWLDELRAYLRGVIRMVDVADSWAYCVVLSDERPAGGDISFKEFVREQHCYFHPYGEGGWPLEPPNFMAFRWDGWVQQIHRVMQADVIPDLAERYPYMIDNPDARRPHAIYSLGPQLRFEPLRCGRNYRARRIRVLLDQLLSAPTLYEAQAGTGCLVKNN